MQRASAPTGGAGEPPARPSAGLRRGLASRERAVSARWLPPRPATQSRGSPRAAARPSRSTPGHRERGPPETHRLRGRRSLGPPGLEGAPRAWRPWARPRPARHRQGPQNDAGTRAGLRASHGPGEAGGSRVKRRPPFCRGESAFSPSPYGHFLSTCSALLASLSALSLIKNHLTYNNRFKRRRSIIS